MRLFLIYVVIELAVVVALASTIGFGWTVLLLLGDVRASGLALAGSQVKRHLGRLRSGGRPRPQGAVTDSVLVALGTVLVVIPGLVSSATGAAAAAAADPRRRAPGADRDGRSSDAADHRGSSRVAGVVAGVVTTSTARSSTSSTSKPRRGARAPPQPSPSAPPVPEGHETSRR